MIAKYLKNAVNRVKALFIPDHPHFTRCYRLPDGTIVTADSFQYDEKIDPICEGNIVTFTDIIASGDQPAKLGSMAPTSNLTSAQFAQQFLVEFNAAGERDNAAAAAAAESASIVEPSSNE